MYIYDALSSDNYLVIDKTLMKIFGNDSAIFIGELFFRRRKYKKENTLQQDGFFYATIASIEESINLSEYSQNKILTQLEQQGLVITEKRGMPAKRFIKLNGKAFQELLDNYTEDKSVCIVPEEFSNKSLKNSVLINNNINNKSSSISKDIDSDIPGATPGAVAKTSQSKLFSSSKTGKTKKQVIQKTNQFISRNQKEVSSRPYSDDLIKALDKYWIMLGESNTLLPLESIKSQLNILEQLPESKRTQAVLDTISHGWKSLQYIVDQMKQNRVPDFDTAKNAQHYLRPKDAPVVDIIAEAKARGEEIF